MGCVPNFRASFIASTIVRCSFHGERWKMGGKEGGGLTDSYVDVIHLDTKKMIFSAAFHTSIAEHGDDVVLLL